jgi:hypothetical protein
MSERIQERSLQMMGGCMVYRYTSLYQPHHQIQPYTTVSTNPQDLRGGGEADQEFNCENGAALGRDGYDTIFTPLLNMMADEFSK